jgi:hypothetical protein
MKNNKKEIKIIEGTPRIDITKVIAYENNARINDHVVQALATSIERFGFNQPIILDEHNVIVCGHTRVKAALLLGMDEIPCLYAKGLTQDEIDAYRLADNKIAEQALWDYEKLEKELNKIGDKIKMTDFGFNESSVNVNSVENRCYVNTRDEDEETDGEGESEGDSEKFQGKPSLHKCPHCGEIFED